MQLYDHQHVIPPAPKPQRSPAPVSTTVLLVLILVALLVNLALSAYTAGIVRGVLAPFADFADALNELTL